MLTTSPWRATRLCAAGAGLVSNVLSDERVSSLHGMQSVQQQWDPSYLQRHEHEDGDANIFVDEIDLMPPLPCRIMQHVVVPRMEQPPPSMLCLLQGNRTGYSSMLKCLQVHTE
jgi:hypothetical protein